jgi:hypothetical protein
VSPYSQFRPLNGPLNKSLRQTNWPFSKESDPVCQRQRGRRLKFFFKERKKKSSTAKIFFLKYGDEKIQKKKFNTKMQRLHSVRLALIVTHIIPNCSSKDSRLLDVKEKSFFFPF